MMLMEQIKREEKDRVPVLMMNGLVLITAQHIEGDIWLINAIDEERPMVQQVLIGMFQGPLVVELRPKKDHKELCGFNEVCLIRQAKE